MTQNLYSDFLHHLNAFNREQAWSIIKKLMDDHTLDVTQIYDDYLRRSLNEIASNNSEQTIPIWQEHLMSNIVRGMIESSHEYVKAAKASYPPTDMKALVFCLEEEYHDLGARMAQDYLEIVGFNAYYIGANTPDREILDAIQYFKPQLVCFSITNYYHLAKLHKLLVKLNDLKEQVAFKIAVGGYAIDNSSQVKNQIQVDFYLKTFDDILSMKEVMA